MIIFLQRLYFISVHFCPYLQTIVYFPVPPGFCLNLQQLSLSLRRQVFLSLRARAVRRTPSKNRQ
jgi:hypothetical protein